MSLERLKQTLSNWRNKRADYEYELSISSSADKKFELKQNIRECEAEIERITKLIDSTIIHNIADIMKQAKQAEHNNNLELAEKLWIQLLALSPNDSDVVKRLKNIWLETLKCQHKFEIDKLNKSYQRQIQSYRNQLEQLEKQLTQKRSQTLEQLPSIKTWGKATPPVAQWNYLPVPNDELDKHDESYSKFVQSSEGIKLIGARVRGKMHKHNGTNCNDWFEFAVSGNWTIIAVSDGAGSGKFSRVGAKASCKAAVKQLATELGKYKIKDRDTKEALSTDLTLDANWSFPGEDIEFVQQALHKAIQMAYDAVKKEADERREKADYCIALGSNRKLDINDLSATLLLAVHTTVKAGKIEYSLILTCQIGDGMLAAISQEGTLKLLGKPDSGGQIEFLTSINKLERNNLVQKTFVFPGNLKALMVMTDGVADDYFPNDPQILELYGDLVLNQVIGIRHPDDSEIKELLREIELPYLLNKVKELKPKFQSSEQVITADGIKEVKISYVDAYAKELGVSPQNVVASSALLWAGATGEPMCDECKDKPPEEKLRIWLDSYYQRGSFDDRTLVVLYREEV